MWVIRVSMKPGEKNVQARAERPLIRLKACGEITRCAKHSGTERRPSLQGRFLSCPQGAGWLRDESFLKGGPPAPTLPQEAVKKRNRAFFVFALGTGVWTPPCPSYSTHGKWPDDM